MNPAIAHLPRNQRRALVKAEASNRKSNRWGEWETFQNPWPNGRGWIKETMAVKNDVFCVLVRHLQKLNVTHLAVASLTGVRPTWHEMQRIKNELCGPKVTAVEVYPPDDEVIDEADMFHIWALPEPLPFSLDPKVQP